MRLVIGGAGSGKKDFLLNQGYSAENTLVCTAEMMEALRSRVAEAANVREDEAHDCAYDRAFRAELKNLLAPYTALYGLQELVFVAPDEVEAYIAVWEDVLAGLEVVACDEVGSGIIPGEYVIRKGREVTGRLCVLLAKRATQVVRLVSGLPIVIK